MSDNADRADVIIERRLRQSPHNPEMNLGFVLKCMRESRGLKQSDLSKLIKFDYGKRVSNTDLSQYEHGKQVPSDEVMGILSDVLEIDYDYLRYLSGKFPKRYVQLFLSPSLFKNCMKAFSCFVAKDSKDA